MGMGTGTGAAWMSTVVVNRERGKSSMIQELGRILVSLGLLALIGFLYHNGFASPEAAEKMGCTNVASVMIGALTTYWLKPESGASR